MKLLQIHDLPNRTILAPEAMVYLSDQLADRQSKFTPSEKGPVEATRSERVPPTTSETEFDNLVHFRQHAQKAGLSELQIWQPNSSESARGTPMISLNAPILIKRGNHLWNGSAN